MGKSARGKSQTKKLTKSEARKLIKTIVEVTFVGVAIFLFVGGIFFFFWDNRDYVTSRTFDGYMDDAIYANDIWVVKFSLERANEQLIEDDRTARLDNYIVWAGEIYSELDNISVQRYREKIWEIQTALKDFKSGYPSGYWLPLAWTILGFVMGWNYFCFKKVAVV